MPKEEPTDPQLFFDRWVESEGPASFLELSSRFILRAQKAGLWTAGPGKAQDSADVLNFEGFKFHPSPRPFLTSPYPNLPTLPLPGFEPQLFSLLFSQQGHTVNRAEFFPSGLPQTPIVLSPTRATIDMLGRSLRARIHRARDRLQLWQETAPLPHLDIYNISGQGYGLCLVTKQL